MKEGVIRERKEKMKEGVGERGRKRGERNKK